MEPQIIDYYNEKPHMMKIIDKMNEEFSDLQKENEKLKEKLIQYETPKILFESIEEYNKLHENMYNKIKKTLFYYFDDSEYKYMKDWGITPRQCGCILYRIESELEKITKNKAFSHIQSYKIMKPIRRIFNGEIPHWDIIYNILSKEQLFDIFYYQIINHIKNNVSVKYALFKCVNCEKINNHVNNENICGFCELNRDVLTDDFDP